MTRACHRNFHYFAFPMPGEGETAVEWLLFCNLSNIDTDRWGYEWANLRSDIADHRLAIVTDTLADGGRVVWMCIEIPNRHPPLSDERT